MTLRALVTGLALAASLAGPTAAAAAPPAADLPPPPSERGLTGPGGGGDDPDGLGPLPGGDLDGADALGDGDAPLDEAARAELRRLEIEALLEQARGAEKSGRIDDAMRIYSDVLRLQPGDVMALLGRAKLRESKTPRGRCPQRAIDDLRLLDTYDPLGAYRAQRVTLLEWLGRCGDATLDERIELARELAAEPVDTAGRAADIRATLAKLLVDQADVVGEPDARTRLIGLAITELSRYRDERRAAGAAPDPEALWLQADLLRDRDEIVAAMQVLDALAQLEPNSEVAVRARARIEELRDELNLRELAQSQGGRPTPEAERAHDLGFAAVRTGDMVTAEREFDRAIELAPWYGRAYYGRGVVHARARRFARAVEDLKRAIRADRSDAQAQLTLGMIYAREFAGAEDPAAIRHLESALRLRPDLARLHLVLGELYASQGDRERGRDHLERYLRSVPLEHPDRAVARRALDDLEREIREEEPSVEVPPPEVRYLDPELQRLINEAIYRGAEKQDLERAEKILLDARERFPDEPYVRSLLAWVAVAQSRSGDARRFWEESLLMREDQADVHEQLGLLLGADLPAEAVPHLQRAAELGSTTARFKLAELLWGQRRGVEASEQLDRYLAEAGPYDLHWDEARRLRASMDRLFWQVTIAASLALFVLVATPTWAIYRRLRGRSLAQLLEREPKSFPEVARILSLIRHEILKHNTAFLSDVGQALAVDAADADARATLLARRLFGEDDQPRPGAPGQRPRGIYGRFLRYVDDLEAVARSYGVRLNLQRKDETFGPMLRAFDRLARSAGALRNPGALRPGRRVELARELDHAGRVLGRDAFARLSNLIRRLCIVEVDATLVGEVLERVRAEDQFATDDVAPLVVLGDGAGAAIRVFRSDLEDILANVLRNSLRSSQQYAARPLTLGVRIQLEEDDITGLRTLALRVVDRSPEQLSNEMLRGRYIERGMGITVDLLSRYDGSIAVEDEPGWHKAVVIRFFAVEDGDADDGELPAVATSQAGQLRPSLSSAS